MILFINITLTFPSYSFINNFSATQESKNLLRLQRLVTASKTIFDLRNGERTPKWAVTFQNFRLTPLAPSSSVRALFYEIRFDRNPKRTPLERNFPASSHPSPILSPPPLHSYARRIINDTYDRQSVQARCAQSALPNECLNSRQSREWKRKREGTGPLCPVVPGVATFDFRAVDLLQAFSL